MFSNEQLQQEYLDNLVELKDINQILINLETSYVEAIRGNEELTEDRINILKDNFLEPIMKKRTEYGIILGKMLDYTNELKNKERKLSETKKKEKEFLIEQNKKILSSNQDYKDKSNLYFRQAEILRYQNYVYEQSVHLLFVLIFVLIISILIIFTSVVGQISKYVSYTVIIAVVSIYILYLVKILFVDKININNFNFRKFDFNKPTEEEISRGKEMEGSFKSIDSNNRSNCPGAIDHGEGLIHEQEDKILDLVKLNTEPDSEKCLVRV